MARPACSLIFFFNDTATTEIYTLSLHDALPIYRSNGGGGEAQSEQHRIHQMSIFTMRVIIPIPIPTETPAPIRDRKSTRLNSSHANISYAVFCLKKKYIRSTLHHPLPAVTTQPD